MSLTVTDGLGLETPRRRGVLLGATAGIDCDTGRVSAVVDALDLDSPSPALDRIPLDCPVHGLALHPHRRLIAAVEKRGPMAAVIDLEDRRLTDIGPLPHHAFRGHAAWSADGAVLFMVEAHLDTDEGALSVRDARTLAVVGRLSTHGFSPHDCSLTPNGRWLAVTNGGGTVASGQRPSLVLIDPATNDLVERRELDDPRRNAGHLAIAADGALAVVSAPRDGLPKTTALGGVALAIDDGPLVCPTEPAPAIKNLVGEALSVGIHAPSRTAVVTHPHANLISFWSLERGFLGALAAPVPRGVAVFGEANEIVVSYGAQGGLLMIDPLTRSMRPLPGAPDGVFGGAHIYPWRSFPTAAAPITAHA